MSGATHGLRCDKQSSNSLRHEVDRRAKEIPGTGYLTAPRNQNTTTVGKCNTALIVLRDVHPIPLDAERPQLFDALVASTLLCDPFGCGEVLRWPDLRLDPIVPLIGDVRPCKWIE